DLTKGQNAGGYDGRPRRLEICRLYLRNRDAGGDAHHRNGGQGLRRRGLFARRRTDRQPISQLLLTIAAESQAEPEKNISSSSQAPAPPLRLSSNQNRRAPVGGGGVLTRRRRGNQLLRSPSAARFHCVTLSAIMRVDFMAAWLSWA